jgi:hypothetical protein
MSLNDEGVEALPVNDFFGNNLSKCASRSNKLNTNSI